MRTTGLLMVPFDSVYCVKVVITGIYCISHFVTDILNCEYITAGVLGQNVTVFTGRNYSFACNISVNSNVLNVSL